jgi:pimeloyl-ACP methyl ester carboxylesterase
VLAHGVTDDGLCWTPVAEALVPDYDVIMVDARGHGRSEATDGGYDAATQADDLAGLIAALGLQQPVVMGHSMGAITALALAGLYPDLPRAILMEDPPPFWMPRREAPPPAPEGRGRGAWISELKGKTREELIALAHEQSPTWSEAEVGPWADAKLRVSPKVAAAFGPGDRALDWVTVVPRVACSALAIMADPDRGAALSPEAAAALKEMAPHVETVHIGGAGHNVRREQLERYMQVVRDFLDRVSARKA